jgi:hypothetical protein
MPALIEWDCPHCGTHYDSRVQEAEEKTVGRINQVDPWIPHITCPSCKNCMGCGRDKPQRSE